jgi:hypothetical protein
MSSDDEEDFLSWDMLEDRKFVMRPGYKFPSAMSYKEMCAQVNMEVQKAGSDAVRPKIRKTVSVGGRAVPASVQFYCCHKRQHKKKAKHLKTPDAKRADRSQEGRSHLFSKCTCCFTIVLDQGAPAGDESTGDEASSDGEDLVTTGEGTSGAEKTSGLSLNTTDFRYFWTVPSVPARGDAPSRSYITGKKGRKKKMCFAHCGHPKRTLVIGDITDDMRADIKSSARTNMPTSTLQAWLFEKYKVYVSLSQLRWEMELMGENFEIVRGCLTTRSRNGNQAESLIAWILEQDDTDAVILIEDVDRSTHTAPAFETWVRVHPGHFSKVLSDVGDFDGSDALKGCQHDEARFFNLDGRRVFLVAIIWTHEYEVRLFSMYPELLVIDGKMNTNKSKLEHFCGVGIEGDWANNVLFRAWLPNKTEHSCCWLWLHGIPALFSSALLNAIRGVMGDDCSTMQPILMTHVCCRSGVLPNAECYLCIYHFQRNFFSKFGMGSSVRQWNLAGSKPTAYRGGNWGGRVEWKYPWQRVLTGAIYQLQQCESENELQACTLWVANVINTAPGMGPQKGALRNAVRKFFQLKLNDQRKWVKWHRLAVRILDANASSRVEGEFGKLWQLGLTAAMTFLTSITKIRFGSDQRMYRKIVAAENYLGSKLKRRGCPLYEMSPEDWQYMCDKFTSHYTKGIEKQVKAAHMYLTCHLVEKNETHATWKVWSKSFGQEDDVDSVDSDEEGNDSVDVEDLPPEKFEENGIDMGEFPDFPSNLEVEEEDEDGFETKAFKWRHVRTVTAERVDGRFVFRCSCKYLERTCVVCRHIFTVFWVVFGAWRVHQCGWHRKTTRKFYYLAVVSDKPLDQYLSTPDVHPSCDVAELDSWLAGQEASTDGVPTPGEVYAADDESVGGDDSGFHDFDDDVGGAGEGAGKKRNRSSNATAASCDQKLLSIVTHLGTPANNAPGFNALHGTLSSFIKHTMTVESVHEAVKVSLGPVSRNATGWNAYARVLDRHLTVVTAQAPVVPPGRPTTNRFRAHYEPSGGAARNHQGAAPSSSQSGVHDQRPHDWDEYFQGKTKQAAWAYLGRWGAKENWIVEVFPDTKNSTYVPGDRWFMKIKNGKVDGPDGKKFITACKWMKKNSVIQLDNAYPFTYTVELVQIKHYGPPDCALFQ